ncbi:BTAD domain-containing putative transcriptional regulator [Herbidospora mongoliensis]|uniref:BTAD domain-containing putative transcriptional regulator n=1 Tax=Herbidospora mongoliensis TaxID=688067 RepID=UPI000834CE2E|nr:BTAD domain-containing putative transcriptional regulator [Herbidospora mongoliensis]
MRHDFRVLGPVEVLSEGLTVDLGPRKQRAVMALLLTHAPRVVALDQIIDALWQDEPPSSATGTLQAYIFQLRKALEPGRSPRTPAKILRTREPGYLLEIDPGQIDSHRFLTAVELAEAAPPEQAEKILTPALALWRGEPYTGFQDEEYLRPTVSHLNEARLTALTTRAEARLALGRAVEVVLEVERLLEAAPYREGLWSLLIRALYTDRRQADALAAYQRCRTLLDQELGLLPSPELRELEQAVLRQEPLPASRVAVVAAPVEPRAEPPRLVGRAAQHRRVRDRVAEAAKGAGGVLLIGGEAGIGKTTLAEAAAELAAEEGFTTAWSRCAEDAPAFWPWIQALRLLDPPTAERLSAPGEAADPDAARFLLLDAVARALEQRAARGPLLIVLEDAHWADAATLKLLTFLGADLHRIPVLVIVTVRHHDAPQPVDVFAELARQRGTERLTVGPLTASDVADYLDARDPGLLAHVAVLHDRTGGNPFYLGELLRLAASTRSPDIAALPVPDGVRDVIAQRVSRLPEETQALLRTASVAGRDVSSDVLAGAAGIDPARLLLLLEPAVATGLLVEIDGGWDYRFSHALVQEALYGELTRLQRAQLHGRIGEAAESLGGGDLDRVPVLAHHFAQAARVGHAEKAVAYAVKAAEQAAAGLAYDEAVRYWELALAAHGPAGTSRRCRLLIELGRARRLTGDVLGARAPLDEAVDLATRLGEDDAAIEAASVFGGVTLWNWRSYGVVDPRMVSVLRDQLAKLPEGDLRRRAELLGTLAVELYYGPLRAEGLAHATEAVSLARRTGDPHLLARTLNNYVIAAWSPERDADRFAAAAEILTLPGLAKLTEVISRLHRMQGLMQDGQIAEYDAELARCQRLTGELRIPEITAQVNYAASGRAVLSGDWAEARRLSALANEWYRRTSLWGPDVIDLMSEFYSGWSAGEVPPALVTTLVDRADDPSDRLLRPTAILATWESGRRSLSEDLLDRWGATIDRDWSWQFTAWQWALVAARLGRPAPETMLGTLLPVAGQIATLGTGCVSWGSMHEAVAELYEALGDPDRARDHARQAARTHRELAIPHLERRSAALLQRLG